MTEQRMVLNCTRWFGRGSTEIVLEAWYEKKRKESKRE
jgi:hypothetical protein